MNNENINNKYISHSKENHYNSFVMSHFLLLEIQACSSFHNDRIYLDQPSQIGSLLV